MSRLVVLVVFLMAAAAAHAQFPTKPVRLIVPFPAGSATDTIGRILAVPVSQALGQPVIVENKAGADGAIAAAEVAKSPPDGYTLLLATNSPMSAVPAMKKVPPYDPVTDFTPITDVGRYTFFIVVHPDVPARSLGELIDFARANPGKLNYATGNTSGIVSTAAFASLANIQMVHVPYKGEPQALTDLVTGRVQLMVVSSGTAVPHIRDGRLRALVTTLPLRSPLLPEVPTIAEAGMPQFSLTSWAGLFGPARLPPEVLGRLSKEFVTAIKRPDIHEALTRQGFAPNASSPAALAELVKEQIESYRRVLRGAGVEPD
jgi:tripartite-type tricarboxylate transporter receptor subunit TctC